MFELRTSSFGLRVRHLRPSSFVLPPFPLAVCCLGLSAFLTQLTLMRELLSVLSGNELVFGIVLGSWMLLTGVGAALGRTAGRLRSPVVVFIAGRNPDCPAADRRRSAAAVAAERRVSPRRGSGSDRLRGLLSGAAGALLSGDGLRASDGLPRDGRLQHWALKCPAGRPRAGHFSAQCSAAVGRVYLLDNLGNVLGGLAFVVVLAQLSDHFVMLYFAAALNLLLAAVLAASTGRRLLAAAAATLLAALLAAAACWNLDDFSCRLGICRTERPLPRKLALREPGGHAIGRAIELHPERRAVVLDQRRRADRRGGPLCDGAAPGRPAGAADLGRGFGHGPRGAQVSGRGASITSNSIRWCSRSPGDTSPRAWPTPGFTRSTATAAASSAGQTVRTADADRPFRMTW